MKLLFVLTLLIPLFSSLLALNVTSCEIVDLSKHTYNQSILKKAVENELACLFNENPDTQAAHLRAKISQIGQELIRQGFWVDAYQIPQIDQHTVLSFNCFDLWEGKHIPLTFFVYAWPSKDEALKWNADSQNTRYCTAIHSHPIPCAFTVLFGILTQRSYETISGQGDTKVRMISQERFEPGVGDVDELQDTFIHKLSNEESNSKICLSLHAYGLPTVQKVMSCFRETWGERVYEEEE